MSTILTFKNELMDIREAMNKVSKPNKDGYYPVALGAFNAYISNGEYFKISDSVMKLFSESSYLLKKLKNGQLKAEADHPEYQAGWTKEQWIARLFDIREQKTCGIFGKIEVDTTPRRVKSQEGTLYLTTGLIKPQGEYGNALKSDLDNPDSNTSFSVRALSKVVGKTPDGNNIKEMISISTYDWVNRGASAVASKRTLTESVTPDLLTEQIIFTDESLVHMLQNIELLSENGIELHHIHDEIEEVSRAVKKCSGYECLINNW